MPGFKKRIAGQRKSKNVQDMTKATFTDKAMYNYGTKTKLRQPTGLTYKEPIAWQHDDLTDETNIRQRRQRTKFQPVRKVKIKKVKK